MLAGLAAILEKRDRSSLARRPIDHVALAIHCAAMGAIAPRAQWRQRVISLYSGIDRQDDPPAARRDYQRRAG